MEGMSDIRNEIEQRLGVFARPGAKATAAKTDQAVIDNSFRKVMNLHDDVERLVLDLNELTRQHRKNEKGKEFDALLVEAKHLFGQAEKIFTSMYAFGDSLGIKKSPEALRSDAIKAEQELRKLPALKQKLDMIRRTAAKVEAMTSSRNMSRPGAKAKMGILDRISRGLSAATAKPVDPTTPQYASGLTAAKKAAEDAKSNYDYMADLNDARFKQLDNYVKVTSSMIAKMNSTADIQRLIAGLKAAVAARVFVQSSMKTPFSRSQAKTVFAYRMSDADRALNTQIRNALSKIIKSWDTCQDLEKILRYAADDNRKNEKGNQFKALKVEAYWLGDKINDLAVEASQLGQYKGRIKTTEELRAEVAKAQDLLRKLAPLNQKGEMIRSTASKLMKSGSFSRLGEKTEFVSQSRQLYTEYKKQINKAFKAAERLQGLASDFEWDLKDRQSAAKKQKKNDKANQFAALIKELNSLLRDMDNVSMDASGLGMEYEQSFEDMKADANKSQDIVRKTAILAAKFDAIKRKASEVQKMNSARITASRPGAKSTHAADGFYGGSEADAVRHMATYDKTCAECNAEDTKLGDKIAMATDPAVSKKIGKLMDEGYPQNQAIAIALEMKRKGEI